MTLILCVDDRGGLSFNGRRQSQDRRVREDLLTMAAGGALWMDDYSRRQFTEPEAAAIRVDRDPAPNSASQSVSANDSPVPVDPSQATGEIEVVYQDANGKEHSATISAVAAQAENYACINAGGDPLRVRQGPGTNYGILCSVYDGDRFPITGKTNGW